LQIDAKNLTNLPAPALSIGDVVSLSVRQNPKDGLGSVALRGLLINAALPENLQPGDKIQAQIIQKGDRVIFKLIGDIESQRATPQNIQQQVVKGIESQFKELFNAVSAPQLKLLKAEDLNAALKNAGILRGTMERLIGNLLKALPSGERLFTPSEIIKELVNSSTGGQLKVLRDLANSIRQFVGEQKVDPGLAQLKDLEQELLQLLLDSAENNFSAAGLIKSLVSELESPTVPKTSAKLIPRNTDAQTRALIDQLKKVLTGPNSPKEPVPSLASLLTNLQQQIADAAARSGALDPRSVEQLVRLAGHLDRIADAEEALNKMNPLLQALGEPAMILFPFLFQGLLSHTEVSVQRPLKKHTGEKKGSGNKENESFQRIKVKVPLQSFGSVGVDVLLNDKELMVRLNIENPEGTNFLSSRFGELQKELAQLGFENAHLSCGVDESEHLPDWSINLGGLGSKIVA
jgi:hypothetical protein